MCEDGNGRAESCELRQCVVPALQRHPLLTDLPVLPVPLLGGDLSLPPSLPPSRHLPPLIATTHPYTVHGVLTRLHAAICGATVVAPQVSYLGHNELTNTPITEAPLVGDDKERLGEMVAKATKDIRKTKDKVGMTLSFGLNGLNASPTAVRPTPPLFLPRTAVSMRATTNTPSGFGSCPLTFDAVAPNLWSKPLPPHPHRPPQPAWEQAGTPIYQPLSKIVYVTYTKEKAVAKTAWIFSYVACDEDNRRGAPNCRYTCFSFKAKDEAEARGIVFATEKMIKTNTDRGRPPCPLAKMNGSQVDDALMWWNDGKSQMYQYKSSRDGGEVTVAGVLKFRCQIDPAVKAISKMVRISSDVYGDELVKMLGDKFNIPDVSFAKYAVYQTQDDGEIHMLDETHNPISQSLLWQDPSEGTFSLKRLPNGLQRVGGDPRAETTESTDSKANTSNSTGTESSSAFMDDVLGPLLPFSEDDEDLLLSVMVSRQSGSGLGFKLTPSYLLQVRLSWCFGSALHRCTQPRWSISCRTPPADCSYGCSWDRRRREHRSTLTLWVVSRVHDVSPLSRSRIPAADVYGLLLLAPDQHGVLTIPDQNDQLHRHRHGRQPVQPGPAALLDLQHHATGRFVRAPEGPAKGIQGRYRQYT